MYAHGALTAGLGLGGGLEGLISPTQVIRLYSLVYRQLIDNNCCFLEFIHAFAFDALNKIIINYTTLGNNMYDTYKNIYNEARGVIEDVFDVLGFGSDFEQANSLAEGILTGDDLWKFAPPEAKGKMLEILCRTFVFRAEELQETAIIKLLKSVQIKKEFDQILKYMSINGKKVNKERSLEKINAILDGKQYILFKSWLNNLERRKIDIRKPIAMNDSPYEPRAVTPDRQAQLYAARTLWSDDNTALV
ncbi:hypothetical protein [Zooshikella harenae]|uniref:Uncharacterized protein n=1 Tax=Zooshikella harenae TaxID=2827238 RepID=A0ABS5ZJD3_9GAMM|nr:hypothetical protein [Zooshikella harenae]MBU2713998.1 hypothetical protein [Zooshikella harenae]